MVSAPKALEEVRFPFQTLNLLMMVMVMTTVLVMIMTIMMIIVKDNARDSPAGWRLLYRPKLPLPRTHPTHRHHRHRHRQQHHHHHRQQHRHHQQARIEKAAQYVARVRPSANNQLDSSLSCF